MSKRFYIMPITIHPERGSRGAKYMTQINQNGYRCTLISYGPEDWGIVRVSPTPTLAHHNFLVADPQVFAVPEDINAQINATQATSVTNKLEAVNIPGTWVAAGMTWKFILLRVAKYCLMLQKFKGLNQNVDKMFDGGRTLETTMGDLTVNMRDQLTAVATAFSFDATGITLASTMREVLTALAIQFNAHIGIVEDDV